MWWGGVVVSTAGSGGGVTSRSGYWPHDARAFADEANRSRRHRGASAVPIRKADPVQAGVGPGDSLRELARLRDDGIVDQAEYEQKKRELLSKM